jgi:hypothetical protein
MDNLPLVLDLVEWIAERPRSYEDVMNAWRTSCPRLSVWEDTLDAGYVSVQFANGARIVAATESGERFLRQNRDPAGPASA